METSLPLSRKWRLKLAPMVIAYLLASHRISHKKSDTHLVTLSGKPEQTQLQNTLTLSASDRNIISLYLVISLMNNMYSNNSSSSSNNNNNNKGRKFKHHNRHSCNVRSRLWIAPLLIPACRTIPDPSQLVLKTTLSVVQWCQRHCLRIHRKLPKSWQKKKPKPPKVKEKTELDTSDTAAQVKKEELGWEESTRGEEAEGREKGRGGGTK